MNSIFTYILIELISNLLLFPLLNKRYGVSKHEGEKMPPWLKGGIERICLITGILLGVPHVLVAFGALKIGTKLGGEAHSNEEKTNTEYYLIGNLISITIAFLFIYLKDKILYTGFDICTFLQNLVCL